MHFITIFHVQHYYIDCSHLIFKPSMLLISFLHKSLHSCELLRYHLSNIFYIAAPLMMNMNCLTHAMHELFLYA
jgi:hypothetical protein